MRYFFRTLPGCRLLEELSRPEQLGFEGSEFLLALPRSFTRRIFLEWTTAFQTLPDCRILSELFRPE